MMQSMMQGVQFLGTIKQEKAIKNTGYLISDNNGNIEGISACNTLFRLYFLI